LVLLPQEVIPLNGIVHSFGGLYFCVLNNKIKHIMKIKFLAIASIIAIVFASCSKDNNDTVLTPVTPTPAPSMVGLWKGKYGNGATTYPTSGYAFLFRADGTVRVFNSTDTATAGKAEGTYTKSGATVTCTYTYIAPSSGTYATSAAVDANFTFVEGTWGSGTNTTNGGMYFLNKQ
jgi:hypothetical protein